MNQRYGAPHFQQAQSENAAQEYHKVAYNQLEMAAPQAASRAVAQMTSMFRDIEKSVEANVNQQPRGLLSEITTESAHALEVQRQY